MQFQKGFSLVEMVLVTLIAGVVGSLLVSLLVQNNGYFFQQSSTIDQGVNLNDAVSEIKNSIRASYSIEVDHTDGSTTHTTGPEALVLSLPSFDASGNVIEGTFDYTVIAIDTPSNNVLRKRVFPDASSYRKGENKVLSNSLYGLKFYYLDKNGLQIDPVSANTVSFWINVKNTFGLQGPLSSASAQVNLKND